RDRPLFTAGHSDTGPRHAVTTGVPCPDTVADIPFASTTLRPGISRALSLAGSSIVPVLGSSPGREAGVRIDDTPSGSRIEPESGRGAGPRLWMVTVAVVVILIVWFATPLSGMAREFLGSKWLAQRLEDVRRLQREVEALGPR